MQQLRRRVDNIAFSGEPLVIQGECGTGKELLARAIHRRSPRRLRAFAKINCGLPGAIPAPGTLVRNPGEDNAAYTAGRSSNSPGVGTILFHEVADLDSSAQLALLTLIQDSRLVTGTPDSIQVICTTRRSLRESRDAGLFRDDLYYCINVVGISVPSLRERRTDIPMLVQYFLTLYSEAYKRKVVPFDQHLMDAFVSADWPGNIRELENAVKRYVILGSAESFLSDLKKSEAGPTLTATPGEQSLKEMKRTAVRACEYNVILASLNRNQWNRRKTARELDISYRSLLYMMDQLGLAKKRQVRAAVSENAGFTEEQ
jgi:two-component system response regulator AtoC